jgi:hypothetical protein
MWTEGVKCTSRRIDLHHNKTGVRPNRTTGGVSSYSNSNIIAKSNATE